MHRAYDVRTVSLALGVSLKWVDNLLSHHELPGITRGRQGVGRTISDDGVLAMELVRLLCDFGVGVARAASIAREALALRSPEGLGFVDPSGIEVIFPIEAVERRLHERMIDALESAPRVPRGRPPLAPHK